MFRGWLALIVALVLNASANILLKVGARTARPAAPEAGIVERALAFLNWPTVLAICVFAANVLAYRKALDSLNISVAYPINVSIGLIIIVLAAWLLPILNEKITLWQLIGMVLIMTGVWLVAGGMGGSTAAVPK